MKNILLCCILLPALVSCSTATTPKPAETVETKVAIDSFPKDSVLAHVPLRSDTAESFALYLPKFYSAAKKYPLMVFFDPHGSGFYPVNRYKVLAEKYNCILAGSNNSKNGLTLEQTSSIASKLLEDLIARLPIEPQKITFAGFSGGAKVALNNAYRNSKVSTVIYSGAAIRLEQPNHAIDFLGFAGDEDMNYSELAFFEHSLNSTTLRHALIRFEGKHEWANEHTFEKAFLFLENKLPKADVFELTESEIESLKKEDSLKQKLYAAFPAQDLTWWKAKIQELSSTTEKENKMNKRLLGFISLASYSIVNNSLQQENLKIAEKTLSIYVLADPNNADAAYCCAVLAAKKQENENALIALEHAIKLGMKDSVKIINEPSFNELRALEGYKKLMKYFKLDDSKN